MGLLVLCGALALGCGNAPVATNGPRLALTLLHTADIHSRVWPFRSRISRFEAELGLGDPLSLVDVGGVARLATLLRHERRNRDALWLDSGDALEGAEVFHRFGGSVELELLSALGLGAMALGNHELSLDDVALGELFSDFAAFPVLAANLRPASDSALSGRLLPSALLEIAGVRVGVVGAANPGSPPNLTSRANPWRLESAPDLATAVQAAVDDIAPRAALIVVLSHLGLEEDRALVSRTSGIDVVLGGHQHILTAEPEWQDDCTRAELQEARGCSPRRVPIVHSGAYARWLSRLELQLAPDPAAPATLELETLTLAQLPVAASVPADAQVEQYLEGRRPPPEPPLAFLSRPLARRSALAGDSALGNLTTDALLAATGADVAIVNSSGLRADLEGGPLLRSDLELVFPFDEPWRLVWLSGRDLRRALAQSAVRSAQRDCESALQVAGLRLQVRCNACAVRGADCLEISRPGPIGDVALVADAWLQVVLPAYLTLGSGEFAAVGDTGVDVAGTAVDFIARYLRAQPRRTEDGLPIFEGGRDGRISLSP
jgi:5'-nucleotidase / UDP-sugar diphosphatase